MTGDYFVTVAELASEMRLSEETLYTWRSRGIGPRSIKHGRRVVYRRSDIDAWHAETEARTAVGGVA